MSNPLEHLMKSASRNSHYSKPYNGRTEEDNGTDMDKEQDDVDKKQRMRKKPAKGEEDREQKLRTNEKESR